MEHLDDIIDRVLMNMFFMEKIVFDCPYTSMIL